MARMTRKLDNGRYAQNYTTGDGFMVGLTEMMQKLGRLEDLEESGQLVILPQKIKQMLVNDYCPEEFGLKSIQKICNGRTERCVKCWEAAMKGEKNEKV